MFPDCGSGAMDQATVSDLGGDPYSLSNHSKEHNDPKQHTSQHRSERGSCHRALELPGIQASHGCDDSLPMAFDSFEATIAPPMLLWCEAVPLFEESMDAMAQGFGYGRWSHFHTPVKFDRWLFRQARGGHRVMGRACRMGSGKRSLVQRRCLRRGWVMAVGCGRMHAGAS